MENPRTEAARDTDDRALIEDAEPAASQQGGAGGNLARDVSSQAELDAIEEPSNHERVTKAQDIAHGQEVRPDRARGA